MGRWEREKKKLQITKYKQIPNYNVRNYKQSIALRAYWNAAPTGNI
jgi:hypothetical protein